MNIETRVAGIPCLARVIHCDIQAPWRGSAHSCESDMDFYGYAECEFEILDRKGRPAPWLERKLTDKDTQRIIDQIIQEQASA
jgi:hypothetical protein